MLAAILAVAPATVGSPIESDRPLGLGHDHAGNRHDDAGDHGPSGHEASEGLRLVAAAQETVGRGSSCKRGVRVRSYRVAAINVDISLNRYLDHDPEGRMYVLEEDLSQVRREEAQNAEARAGRGEPALRLGLQGDAIQPLALRVNQGECLRVTLRNALEGGEPASFHLHESELSVAGGGPAIATNPKALAGSRQSITYEWMVSETEPEATHYFHGHGNPREQAAHGLFGALIVEPQDSVHLDPTGGGPLRSGWAAIIRDAKGSDFREFVLFYHEIGDESYQLIAKDGQAVPIVDPLTDAYRPGSRALNYRSESFMNRLRLQQEFLGKHDESVAYSSYVFGDPATPILRSYLGDPVKQRVLHAGSEVSHVHHVHGGSIRWRRQPGVEPSGFDSGLQKHPSLRPKASERVDSQTIGPSETFDTENECGSGGCQQSAGDFLIHCHVAHHYFAGMWGLWRVYNTKQEAEDSPDLSLGLEELPDRRGQMEQAVTSQDLLGKTVEWYGRKFDIGKENLHEWVQRQLPPRGMPKGYDASVLDYGIQEDLYLNEVEDDRVWPGYSSPAPGTRPPLSFDPKTGKLAYPFLRPHLGKRPPFAPNHGPAPFLDPIQSGPDPPAPGANGPGSVCPEGTRTKTFLVQAITLPITLNAKANLVDPAGEIFVLKQQEDAVRADNALRVPLAIRANAGQDCVDLVLRSELEDSPMNRGFSKVNAHVHFAQFDVQASDGVIAGFNYEQSVRPFVVEGETIVSATRPGATSMALSDTGRFQRGVLVGIGMDQDEAFEVREVKEVRGNSLVFETPLESPHARDEIVSTEFVRYRWYPDVQFGTAYFHDHVNALVSWRHGLFGALIGEPPNSTHHDPLTGEEIESGPIADIHTDQPISADVTGSFRELVLFIQDDNPLTRVGRSAGGSYNLRVESLDKRQGDPTQRFSSVVHGDPETPVLEAFLGDPVVFRTLVAGTNEVHTFHIDGHWFRAEPWSKTSPPITTGHLGISERYDLVVPKAGGPQARPGDYLYYSGRSFKFREGSWGMLRVLDASESGDLTPLPGRDPPEPQTGSVCPPKSPRRRFSVAAIEASLPMLEGDNGKIYVLQSEKMAVQSGERKPHPLVLHVGLGDCIEIDLTNETTGPAALHVDNVAYDPRTSGVPSGRSAGNVVATQGTGTYTYYAHPELGEAIALVRDWGDVLVDPGVGLYGAIVVGPRDARYRTPGGSDESLSLAGWNVEVKPPKGNAYRDFTIFMQDQDAGIGGHRMPYVSKVDGVLGLNYSRASFEASNNPGPTFDLKGRDPDTPLLEAMAGDQVRIHVLSPWSEQAQVFSIEGHRWPFEPERDGSDMISSVTVGGLEAITLKLDGGAGGASQTPGDYIYGDHRGPYLEAGLWGVFRVTPYPSSRRLQIIIAVAAAILILTITTSVISRLRQQR